MKKVFLTMCIGVFAFAQFAQTTTQTDVVVKEQKEVIAESVYFP